MSHRSETSKVTFLISHETHPNAPMLKFLCDRQNYLYRLRCFKPSTRFSILDYLLTPTRIYLLLNTVDLQSISIFMHKLQGTAAMDYARRKSVEGPFWKGRFQVTLIQPGCHIFHCMLTLTEQLRHTCHVIHPAEWPHAGYHELTGHRQRNRIIDRKKLLNCLIGPTFSNFEQLREEYIVNVEQRLDRKANNPLAPWQTALAVGGKHWIERVAKKIPSCHRTLSKLATFGDEQPSWVIKTSQGNQRYYLKKHLKLVSTNT